MSKISERLADALQRFTADEEKFEQGNRSAGVRARKALMEIKSIASEGRKAISTAKPEKAPEEAAA